MDGGKWCRLQKRRRKYEREDKKATKTVGIGEVKRCNKKKAKI